MPASAAANIKAPNKKSIPFLLALIAAGLAGNYLHLPLFLNIDFLFGSIFALLVLQFCGLGRAILAAAIISSYTVVLYNHHPSALIIMTGEVAAVGWLMERRNMGMVLADTLYWLVIGMPLLYFFSHIFLHAPDSNTHMIMTKQAVNGIANALIARLIFTCFLLWSRAWLMPYREIIYNLLAFFVLMPALLLLAVGSRDDFADTDHHVRSTLIQESQSLTNHLETWVENRRSTIVHLAEMAASRLPGQMQAPLEQAQKSDINLLRIGLLDRQAITLAYAPQRDETGQSNIGKSFADRPYIPLLQQGRWPLLSEVMMGKVGTPPRPVVAMMAPVLMDGEYGGFIGAILALEQIRLHLDKNTYAHAALYTLLDKNGHIIMTNRPDQTIMTPLQQGKGELHPLEKGLSQWVPRLPPQTAAAEQWQHSSYRIETTIGALAEWQLILEQPVVPFQKRLYSNYTGKLTLLFVILLGALALAESLSRRIVATLARLQQLTRDLPIRLKNQGNHIAWPHSSITEAHYLINNFRTMGNRCQTSSMRSGRSTNRWNNGCKSGPGNWLRARKSFAPWWITAMAGRCGRILPAPASIVLLPAPGLPAILLPPTRPTPACGSG